LIGDLMRRIALILILLLSSFAHAEDRLYLASSNPYVLGGAVPAPVGPTCSGDFSSGQNESFENSSGDGYFCTTDWSVVSDAGSAINTYDNNWNFCGTHSMSIIYDSDSPNNQVRINLGSEDPDFYFRYYFKYSAVSAYAALSYMPRFGNDSDASFYVTSMNNTDNSRHELKLRQAGSGSGYSTEYFRIYDGYEYRVEIHVVGSAGTTTAKLFYKNGASWDAVLSSTGGDDYEINLTATQTNHKYIDFISNSSSATAVTIYFDDVKISLSGGDYIGGDTCD